MRAAVALACFLLVSLAGDLRAQPAINPSIAQAYGGGVVNAIAVQPDGKIIIGGEFTHVQGVRRNNIARLNADLSLDTTWNPDASATVYALAIEGSAVYVGGLFAVIGGLGRSNLAKLSTSGTGAADPAWGNPANGSVTALAVDGVGNVYAGGYFTQMGAAARNRLAKLSSANGTLDATWNPGADAPVLSLALRAGDLYAGGEFTNVGGQPRNRIAKVAAGSAGAVDMTWNPGANGEVSALATDEAGNVYAAGWFTNVGGAARNYIARLAEVGGGAADVTWNPGANHPVKALLPGPGGTIFASGFFTFAGGRAALGVVRLFTAGAGAADPAFNVAAAPNGVHAMSLGASGELHVGGAFQGIGTSYRGGFAALSAATGATLGQSAMVLKPGTVRAVAVDGSGRATIAGSFITVGDRATERVNLARFNADGTLDAGWQVRTNGYVVALAADAAGQVYVGGSFSEVSGVARGSLAKISAAGQVLAWAPGAAGIVNAIIVDGLGSVIVGGTFANIGGVARNNLALIGEGTGTVNLAWNPNPDGSVDAMALDGSNLYIGGLFTQAGGFARGRVAKVSATTGALDASWNPSVDGNVNALATDGAGSVYIGGNFGSIGGQARSHVAKVSTTGSGTVDPQWNPAPSAFVSALAAGAGQVYIGGQFESIGGVSRAYLTRVPTTGTGVPDPAWNPAPDWLVLATKLVGVNLHVGGRFGNIAGKGSAAYAVLGPFAGPGAPVITQTMTGDAQAALLVDRGPVDGGLPLTFQATCNPGNVTGSSTVSPVIVRGLANGTTYTCSTHASNAVGVGPESSTATVTPMAANVAGLGRGSNGMPFIADVRAFLKTCPGSDPATAVILASMRLTLAGVPMADEPCTAPIDVDTQPSPRLWAIQALRIAYYMDAGATGLYPWTPGTYWDWLRSVVGTIETDPALTGVAGYCCVPVPSGQPLPQMVLRPPQQGVSLFTSAPSRLIGLVTHEARHGQGHFHVACTSGSGFCDPEYNVADLSAYGVAWWVAKLFVFGEINVGARCTPEGRDWVAGQANFLNVLQPLFNGAKPPIVTPPAEPGGPCLVDTSLVGHYYRSILRRDPDAGGKAFWEAEATRMTQLGANVSEAYFAMAIGFFNSAEYVAFNRNPTEFVRDLYATFFDRAADDGGLAHWTGQLASGMPREVVLAGFMFSAEFAQFMRARFGDTTARAEVDVVVDFYRGLLTRLPDSSGFTFWVGRFRTAQCQGAAAVSAQVEAISSAFALSAEYSGRARTPTQYVGDLYNAFLRRGGDLGGVQFWIGQVASGTRTREQVRRDFLVSPEFSARVTRVLQQGCLQ